MDKERQIELIRALQSGDTSVADEFFSEIYNDVYYFALKTVKDEDLAADITQEALIEVFSKIGDLQDPAAFPAWCRQITYHQCTRYFRKKKDVLLESNGDDEEGSLFDTVAEDSAEFIPEEALDQKDFKKTVLEFIDTLSEEQRSAVIMYYFDELSVSQIAKIQGVSEGTIKSRLNYARKSIKALVEDYEKKNGIKLHALPFFPLFKFLFSPEKAAISAPASAVSSAAAAITAETGVAVTAGTATTAAVTAGAATTATATTVGIGAKLATIPLATKIIAGIVAAGIAVGGTTAIITNLPEQEAASDLSSIAYSSTASENKNSETPEIPTAPTIPPAAKEVFDYFVADTFYLSEYDSYTDCDYYVSYTVTATFYPQGNALYSAADGEYKNYKQPVVMFDFEPSFDEFIPLDYSARSEGDVSYILEYNPDCASWEEFFTKAQNEEHEEFVEINGVLHYVFNPPMGGGGPVGPIYGYVKEPGGNFTLTPLSVSEYERIELVSLKENSDSTLSITIKLPDGSSKTLNMTKSELPYFSISFEQITLRNEITLPQTLDDEADVIAREISRGVVELLSFKADEEGKIIGLDYLLITTAEASEKFYGEDTEAGAKAYADKLCGVNQSYEYSKSGEQTVFSFTTSNNLKTNPDFIGADLWETVNGYRDLGYVLRETEY